MHAVVNRADWPLDPDSSPSPFSHRLGQARPARVVYFIASHVHPTQVMRLLRTLRAGSDSAFILIHHDYEVSHLDPAPVAALGNTHLLLKEHAPVAWGAFSQCEMIGRSMQWLLANRDFDWVVYLSGQDYPIKPIAQIERELGETLLDGFLSAAPVDALDPALGLADRYYYHCHDLPHFPGWGKAQTLIGVMEALSRRLGTRYPSLHLPAAKHGRFRVAVKPRRFPFNDRLRCFTGSSWWTLNRRSIESMCRFMNERPDVCDHYRRAGFAPNESFFLTALMNNRGLNFCSTNNRRLIRWTHPETGHPDTLTCRDWDYITRSNAHFARKIDGRKDPVLLDMLDSYLTTNRRCAGMPLAAG